MQARELDRERACAAHQVLVYVRYLPRRPLKHCRRLKKNYLDHSHACNRDTRDTTIPRNFTGPDLDSIDEYGKLYSFASVLPWIHATTFFAGLRYLHNCSIELISGDILI
jgi:hypothetical protein